MHETPNPDPAPPPVLRLLPRLPRGANVTIAAGLMIAAVALNHYTTQTYAAMFGLLRGLPLDGYYAWGAQWPTMMTFVVVVACVWKLDEARRHMLPALLAALLMGNIANETVKHVTGRARPQFGLHLNDNGTAWIEKYVKAHPEAPIQAEKRDVWLWFAAHRPIWADAYSSFPSGHSMAAGVLAAFLCVLYPRLKWLWIALAILTGAARVEKLRHYPGDVIFGGALGWLVAMWVFTWRWPVEYGLKLSRAAGPPSGPGGISSAE